ncbi:beta-ketoacyl-[acyl-carrier-protein] synthase family protein [Streptomyces sp. NPDC019531]|uniref:beta-ketoacyl-[acyl-carrier-protein] synthase family protein n=1 Tax=Streptomyces sp. NPDC019531 TaxID=3365062 RepID=UPI00384B435F
MSAVVTGVGAVSPIGARADDVHHALLAGESGIGLLDGPEFAPLPTRLAGRADIEGRLDRVTGRTLERVQRLALVAAQEAWDQAKADDVEPERLAVVVGTAIGGAQAIPGQTMVLREQGPRRINPYLMSLLMPNASAGKVALHLGARGGAHAPVSACASGAEAIALALDLLRLNRADVVVAGGAESCLHPMTLAGFAQLRALSRRESDPAGASRPFDEDRDGFVLGEGAGMLVLERAEHAEARGARTLGTLLGAAVTSDAHHMIAPDPEGAGAARCIELALRDADLIPADIGHINSHGTATPAGDRAESQALCMAFGAHRPAVTATKSCTGHLLGASGAVEAVATVLALRDGLVPPVRNLDRIGDGIDLDLVRHRPREVRQHAALSTSIGFGGHNTALVLAR